MECTSCEITYTDKSNITKTIKHTTGKWEYRFNQKINFELKLSIKTSLTSQQTINAYILKNKETVYGNTGYKYADITYNTQNAKGTNSFGSYRNSEPGNGGNNNGGTPTSSACGARTKSGGSCKQMVVGGGRCWQHR